MCWLPFSATARAVALMRPAALLLMHTVKRFQHALCLVQAYRRVLEHVKAVTGLPESRLLDVRGNHDTFNVPSRCSHVS